MSKMTVRYKFLKNMTYKDGLFYSGGKPTYDVFSLLETCYQEGLKEGIKEEDTKQAIYGFVVLLGLALVFDYTLFLIYLFGL